MEKITSNHGKGTKETEIERVIRAARVIQNYCLKKTENCEERCAFFDGCCPFADYTPAWWDISNIEINHKNSV